MSRRRADALKDVREQTRQQLMQEKRQKAIADWSKETNDEFDDNVHQVGYAPPTTTGATTVQE